MAEKIRGNWIGEKEINKRVEVIILCHESSTKDIIAFDVFVRKDIEKEKPRLYRWLKSFSSDYETECSIAEMFQKRHRKYKYVFSQDFDHILYCNVGVLNTLLQIARKFKTAVVLFEEVGEND